MSAEHVVIDASALVDVFVAEELGPAVEARLDGCVLHAPAHADAEVLSGLGRLHRAGDLGAAQVRRHLEALSSAPIERHALADLLLDAWARRSRLRLADALYVELAERLDLEIVTTDARLARTVPRATLVVA